MNHHTLADFRAEKQKELDELFTQVLAALSKEGLITLEQVMQDGTKIKVFSSTRSYHHEETIQGHLERAPQRLAEMSDPRKEESSPEAKQAQACARREQQERLERVREELQKLQEHKSGELAKSKTKVSTSDPQARVMRHSGGGLALSCNAQISTDPAHGLIVGVAVTQSAQDSGQLLPAVTREFATRGLKAAGSETISRTRFSEGTDGDVVGMLYLQLAAPDDITSSEQRQQSHEERKPQDQK